MKRARVSWKSSQAEGSFAVDQEMCLSETSDVVHLPSFSAPGDDDLTWNLSLKPGEMLGNDRRSLIAKKISLRLHFQSASAKTSAFVQRWVKVTQTASREDIDSAVQELSGGNVALTKGSFELVYNAVYREVKETCWLGEVVFLNKRGNELNIDVTVKMSDGASMWSTPRRRGIAQRRP